MMERQRTENQISGFLKFKGIRAFIFNFRIGRRMFPSNLQRGGLRIDRNDSNGNSCGTAPTYNKTWNIAESGTKIDQHYVLSRFAPASQIGTNQPVTAEIRV